MASSTREFADRSVDPHVVGFLHTPETPNGDGLVLTHSAGGNAQAPLLRALAETFATAGYTVLRCNLPFRQVRSFGPPSPADGVRDRVGLKNAIAALRKAMGDPVPADVASKPALSLPKGEGFQEQSASGKYYLGGHSYGGRQASMLCAEEPGLVAGLLLLSYPLHPPRRPEQQRTQHLPDLRTPTLFVSGTRDPFGSIEEIDSARKMIPAKTILMIVEGAGHDLGIKENSNPRGLFGFILKRLAELEQTPTPMNGALN